MSSFGSCSVGGHRTRSGRGANGVESEGAGPHGGDAAGERGRADADGGRGAAGGDAAPHEASEAAVRGRGRRRGRPRAAGPEVEPRPCAGGARGSAGDGGGAGVRGLRPDAAGRARRAGAGHGRERGHGAPLADRGRAVDAQAQAGEAPEPSAAPRGAGRAGAVGQFGSRLARGSGTGRLGAGGAARRRDGPDAARALRRARHGRGEPAGDHRVHRAPRSAVGRVHGPRRTLRPAGEGRRAHEVGDRLRAGSAGRRVDPGGLAAGEGGASSARSGRRRTD